MMEAIVSSSKLFEAETVNKVEMSEVESPLASAHYYASDCLLLLS
jgi:hypothetical protein